MPAPVGPRAVRPAAAASAAPALPASLRSAELQRVMNGGQAIAVGARGEGVKQVQAGLKSLGYAVAADGAFGNKTKALLGTFQAKVGVDKTEQIDRPTLSALAKALEAAPAEPVPPPAPVTPPAPAGTPVTLANNRFSAQPQLAEVAGAGAVLRPGARGDGVQAVQEALVDMGFSLHGGADGAHGPQSVKAVKNFQRHARSSFSEVQANGNVDAPTLKALDALALPAGQKGQKDNLPVPFFTGKDLAVVVVKDEHRTFFFKDGAATIFGNAVGAPGTQTSSGLRKVTGKLDEATTRATGQSLWGNPNVFGPRIIDLSLADGRRIGTELHGTSAPKQLGEDVSHGCMRHANADIIALFNLVKVGDLVAVVDSLKDPNLRRA